MQTAGLLLTGGASRRMGRDKALLASFDGAGTLAERTGRLLAAACDPAIEVGPGFSGLRAVPDPEIRPGPVAAAAAGAEALRAAGHRLDASVVLLATDLPHLSAGLLSWLVEHPFPGAVVPLDETGMFQPLCARYPLSALLAGAELVAAGPTSFKAVLATVDVTYAPPAEWAEAAGGAWTVEDVDTAEDLARAGGIAERASRGFRADLGRTELGHTDLGRTEVV